MVEEPTAEALATLGGAEVAAVYVVSVNLALDGTSALTVCPLTFEGLRISDLYSTSTQLLFPTSGMCPVSV